MREYFKGWINVTYRDKSYIPCLEGEELAYGVNADPRKFWNYADMGKTLSR
jgi:hypothetical protein